MVPSSLLYLLAICVVHIGQTQTAKECYKCDFKFYSRCLFTVSQSVLCADDTFNCGSMKFLLGTQSVFDKYGCFQQADCNKSAQVTGVLNMFQYNSTCCTSNFCNGGFTAEAPRLLLLGTLSIVLLYIVS